MSEYEGLCQAIKINSYIASANVEGPRELWMNIACFSGALDRSLENKSKRLIGLEATWLVFPKTYTVSVRADTNA